MSNLSDNERPYTDKPRQDLTIDDQFKPLPDDDYYLDKYGIATSIPSTNKETVRNSRGERYRSWDFPKCDLSNCLRRNGPISPLLIQEYLTLLMDTRNGPGRAPYTALPAILLFHKSFWENTAAGTEHNRSGAPYRGISTGTEWLKHYAQKATKAERREDLLNIEYILIPQEYENGHWALLVVSMQTKIIDWFDSNHATNGHRQIYYVLEWLTYELREIFKLEEWSYRINQCPKQEVPILGMKLIQDGGVHVCINAWNCVHGFYNSDGKPLFNNGQHVDEKRRRIVVDLLKARAEPDPVARTADQNTVLGLRSKVEQLSFLVPVTRVQYLQWAHDYRRDSDKRSEPEIPQIQGPEQRRKFILELARKLTPEGRDVSFKEKDGWTTGVLKQYVFSCIDEQKGGYEKLWDSVEFWDETAAASAELEGDSSDESN